MNPLKHLPEHKQKELAEIVRIIIEVTEPLKIILFGSHTTDEWVEDEYFEGGTRYTYFSDYDILVVLPNEFKKKEQEIASKIKNRTPRYKSAMVPIIHTISYINEGLERGQYFFKEIVEDGIVLFDSGDVQFAKARELSVAEQREEAEYYYEKWVESGSRMLDHTKIIYQNAIDKKYKFNEVMFLIHQSAELLYAGLGLVFTGYKPKTHSIEEYRNYTKNISNDIDRLFCFPPGVEEERLFSILQKSYIDARYKDNYHIEKSDLEELLERIIKLEELVVKVCKERVSKL